MLDGDATRPRFDAAAIPGDVVVWAEALLTRPPSPRAAAVERAVADAPGEVVLWFDEDLFCRIHAAWMAHRFPAARLREAVGVHAAATPDALRACFERRRPLDAGLGDAWRAFAADDPRGLSPLLARFPWLRLHAERFPHPRDGLGAAERRILEALRARPLDGPALHRAIAQGDLSAARYGLTDVETEALARGLAPLAEQDDAGRWRLGPAADDVLAGRRDRVRDHGIDARLGGATLRGRGPVWRWDGRAFGKD